MNGGGAAPQTKLSIYEKRELAQFPPTGQQVLIDNTIFVPVGLEILEEIQEWYHQILKISFTMEFSLFLHFTHDYAVIVCRSECHECQGIKLHLKYANYAPLDKSKMQEHNNEILKSAVDVCSVGI